MVLDEGAEVGGCAHGKVDVIEERNGCGRSGVGVIKEEGG